MQLCLGVALRPITCPITALVPTSYNQASKLHMKKTPLNHENIPQLL